MSFVQRRKFLWMCFLASLILLGLTAAFASATTLTRLAFEDLAQQSSAVARLRCLGSEFRWDRGELWTETRFEVLERSKGLLSGIVTVRTMGGVSGHLHSHVDAVPIFRAGEEVYLFLWERPGGSVPASPIASLAGRKARFASRATRTLATKP
ncbi:MAG: hypothetical protein JWO71_1695 [Candidatus Acidoferrum typicum]|nr:hypothetical protein [Candidatus Acidoferrum typicum]